jgi:hypothetical protein
MLAEPRELENGRLQDTDARKRAFKETHDCMYCRLFFLDVLTILDPFRCYKTATEPLEIYAPEMPVSIGPNPFLLARPGLEEVKGKQVLGVAKSWRGC